MQGAVARKLTSVIGAEISGVDLREDLDDELVEWLSRQLNEHLVLFFREQPLDAHELLALAGRFGTVSIPAFVPKGSDLPGVMVLDQTNPKGEGADIWHSDNTYMTEPPMGSILQALQLPSAGGDTCFANMYRAFEELSKPMQEFLCTLTAVHDLRPILERSARKGLTDVDVEAVLEDWPPAEHPLVRTHPVTGRKALFVNGNMTTHIKGMNSDESSLLLTFLFERARSPELQCRFHWQANSIAFWDNRSTQHYAVADYTERRVMQRVTIAGDRPY